ncbi:hypothetical protein ACHQM5_028565 [Ranunculus cassubicifolius]
MIESAAGPEEEEVTKQRYAPPNQRNHLPLNRPRKSSSSMNKTSGGILHLFEPQPATPITITMQGCSSSQAAHLLSQRWLTAIHSHNDPSIHLSERPVMYSGAGASAWGHSRLSHQMDFLTELRRAMTDAGAC